MTSAMRATRKNVKENANETIIKSSTRREREGCGDVRGILQRTGTQQASGGAGAGLRGMRKAGIGMRLRGRWHLFMTPKEWKRAEWLYQHYKCDTREYRELAAAAGLNTAELNRRIWQIRHDRRQA